MQEAAICASCPEAFHDRASELCRRHGIQKAFGKAGDMLNSLSGKDWVPKWEAKVVMATVTKAQTMGVDKALILCIAGGKNCDAEMARQPNLVRAIKREMEDPHFRVRVEWVDKEEFLERYDIPATPAVDRAGKKGVDAAAASAPKGKGEGTGVAKAKGKAKGRGEGQGKAADKPLAAEDGKRRGEHSSAQASENTHTHTHTAKGAKDQGSKAAGGKGSGGHPMKGSEGSPNNPKAAVSHKTDAKKDAQAAGASPKTSAQKQVQASHERKELCKFFAQGQCRNGAACKFTHEFCKFFAQGQCRNGAACKFSHELDGPPGGKSKTGSSAKDGRNRVQCQECGKSFKDWAQVLQKHWWCKGHEPLCMCVQCGHIFDLDTHCEQHQADTGHKGKARVNDTKPPTWACAQCEKEFASCEACEQHMAMMGHGNTPLCLGCLKRFGSKKAVNQHQDATGHIGIEWLNEGDSDSSAESSLEALVMLHVG